MTNFTRRDLPADIAVFAGEFASQPPVFAHLLEAAPTLDLDHVEVVQGHQGPRLSARFDPEVVDHINALAEGWNTIVLILPPAYDDLDCPVDRTTRLVPLGTFRGTIVHLTRAP